MLLDAHDPMRRGGTGRTIDWTRRRGDGARAGRTILSGGLNAGNVGEAIAAVRPYVIDVSSGVEVGARRQGSDEAARASSPRSRGQLSDDPIRLTCIHLSDSAILTRAATTAPTAGGSCPETLVAPVEELRARLLRGARRTRTSARRSTGCCATTSAAPTPLYEARRLSESLGGARIFLKREDLAHTGAHKINNALGQALLAQRMGKRRIIAETGAGQHGVATATVCALLGLECDVYMGAEDMERQSLNVFRMQLLGADGAPRRRRRAAR